MQHTLSSWIEQVRFDTRVAACKEMRDRARLLALTAKNTGHWLYGSCYTVAPRLWLDAQHFFIAARIRLGLPIGEEHKCNLCRHAHVSDAYGVHSLSCLGDGGKTRMHAAVLDEIVKLAQAADASPRREAHALPLSPNLRLDAAFTLPLARGHQVLIDVAITNCLAAYNVTADKLGPGRAATAYERVKNDKYANAVKQQLPNASFLPAVFDIFGAVGDAFAPALATLAQHRARRSGVPEVTVMRTTLHRINFVIVDWVARIASANAHSPAV